jgi:uncharacterized protein (TIGR02996 family)
MRTFQYSDEKSHKFWTIEVQGTSFTVTYGKIGTAGQTQTKSWPTEEKAKAEAEKLIKEKTGKGYTETTPAATSSEDEALIKGIQAHPYDLAVHSAYADWLIERGNPRGEFMQVQIALEDESLKADARKKLKEREAALLKKHRKEWVGEWESLAEKPGREYDEGTGPFGKEKYHFERGLLKGIAIGELKVTATRALVKDPELKFVHTLFVGEVASDEGDEDEEVVLEGPDIPEEVDSFHAQYVLLRWPQLKHIRKFYWGWYPDEPKKGDDYYFNCNTTGDHAYDFVKQMPDIEELRLCAHVRDAKKIVALPMPNLRLLQLYHGWDFPLDKLAANKTMTNLEKLLCHPHGLEDDEPYIRYKHVKAICASKYLGNLKHLQLRCSDLGDKGVKEIVESGLLKQLKVLELQLGVISDEGAKLLAESPDIKNLELLDLSKNGLTKAGIELLKKTGVNLIAKKMHEQTSYDPDEDNEFLWEGDAE